VSERQPKSDQVTPTITLELLNRIEENSSVTQRSLARELGIALGLANTYLKRCAKKGLIKIQHIPANRYAYYLTPKGFAEKSRLTSEYLRQSFQFFRFARDDIGAIFKRCEANGDRAAVCERGGSLGRRHRRQGHAEHQLCRRLDPPHSRCPNL
jgi:DNA-binding MarR family transcriptional regulator